jgi:hypothetical protein
MAVFAVPAVSAMHEQMKEWAGEEDQERQDAKEVCPMLGGEKKADNAEEAQRRQNRARQSRDHGRILRVSSRERVALHRVRIFTSGRRGVEITRARRVEGGPQLRSTAARIIVLDVHHLGGRVDVGAHYARQ